MIWLDWREFVKVKALSPQVNELDEIEEKWMKFPLLFREKDGRLKNFKDHLQLKPDAIPKFKKTRATSYHMRKKLDLEYQRLHDEDIVEDDTYSDWASPPVPVLKRDGSVRVCGDYKVRINPVLKREIYALPTPDDLLNKSEGGIMFAKLDLSHAYQRIELDEESQKLMVLNTHQGLLKYKRLNYGVASATAIFKHVIKGVLQGIPGTAVYLDDIIVTGRSKEECESNLDQTLRRLEDSGLTLRMKKCEFDMQQVSYLGYLVSAQGLETLQECISPVLEAPAPSNVAELKSLLGMLTYYHLFLPDVSTKMKPLHELLR